MSREQSYKHFQMPCENVPKAGKMPCIHD